MKGLLTKDFKLMTRQKTTLLMVLVIIAMFPALDMDPGFIVTYTMMILLFMSVSTISYDDFDNGMAFLFTLPVDRKTYVREKYALGLLTAVSGWLLAALVNAAYIFILSEKAGGTIADILFSGVVIFPVALIMWEVLLPLQLKFGSEKAKLVIFIVAGIAAAIGVIASKMVEKNPEQVNNLLEKVKEIGPSAVGIVFFAVAIIGLLISYACSVKIMEKKEY